MGLDGRKPVFGVSDQVRPKPLAQLQRLAKILKFCMELVGLCTFQIENNKGAGQTVRMHRLVCTFVVPIQQSSFLTSRPIFFTQI